MSILTIKVLAPGCHNCHQAEEVARRAVLAAHELSLLADLVKSEIIMEPELEVVG